jgi:aspartyl-tRNA(Asn)/glutamyl-tRNA(Gln) amidotransferase subunit C
MADAPLSTEAVEAVARLARLEVGAGEMDGLRAHLAAVLGHAERLGELDLSGVAPLTHVGEETNRFADPEPGPTMSAAEALALAPDAWGRYFRVPRVLGEGGGA